MFLWEFEFDGTPAAYLVTSVGERGESLSVRLGIWGATLGIGQGSARLGFEKYPARAHP